MIFGKRGECCRVEVKYAGIKASATNRNPRVQTEVCTAYYVRTTSGRFIPQKPQESAELAFRQAEKRKAPEDPETSLRL